MRRIYIKYYVSLPTKFLHGKGSNKFVCTIRKNAF